MDEASMANPPTKVAHEPESAREAQWFFPSRHSWADSRDTVVIQSTEMFLGGGSTKLLAT
jgi:hypothetical protein